MFASALRSQVVGARTLLLDRKVAETARFPKPSLGGHQRKMRAEDPVVLKPPRRANAAQEAREKRVPGSEIERSFSGHQILEIGSIDRKRFGEVLANDRVELCSGFFKGVAAGVQIEIDAHREPYIVVVRLGVTTKYQVLNVHWPSSCTHRHAASRSTREQ